MKEYFEILKRSPLFAQIKEEELSALLHCLDAQVKSFQKKQTILAEGSAPIQIGVLLSGTAQILRVDYYGNRSILSEIGDGEIFAEAFACAQSDTVPVTVVAEEACTVLLLNAHRILHGCAKPCDFHRQMIFNLMKVLAIKNIMFHQKIEITSKRSTAEKLMAYLMLQAKKAKSNSFDIPFNRQELADYLEVERSGLSTEIGKLRRKGVLECQKNHFRLL